MVALMNKKGDIPSLIYVVVIIFAIAVVFLFMNKLNHSIFVKEKEIFGNSTDFQNSSAISVINKIQNVDDVAWDWAFLGIYIGGMLGLIMTSYAARISIVFFWIYIIMSLLVLLLGVMLSNAWQTMVASDSLSDAVARFPITDFLLGSYAPIVVTALILITALVLFGKIPESSGGVSNG